MNHNTIIVYLFIFKFEIGTMIRNYNFGNFFVYRHFWQEKNPVILLDLEEHVIKRSFLFFFFLLSTTQTFYSHSYSTLCITI